MFFLFKNFSKFILIISFLGSLTSTEIVKSQTKNIYIEKDKELATTYLDSKNELEDYIIDKGDSLFIDFYPATELSGIFPVNQEGEIYLPRLNETNVSGLTPSDLEKLLNESYSKFLISPEIKVKIAVFKEIKVSLSGEARYTGTYKFPPYKSKSLPNFLESNLKDINSNEFLEYSPEEYTNPIPINNAIQKNYFQNQSLRNNQFGNRKDSRDIIKVSDVLKKAGGITSKSDLSRIEIIRDIPFAKGGGKKIAVINLNDFLEDVETENDIRVFDGDRIFIPSLNNENESQIPKSVIKGLSPGFISVNVYGRVENPGTFMLPLEGTLSDAIDITGPIKALSGKVILIRYNNDGKVEKKKISYSANAKRGSRRNPFIKEGDLITVTNSVFGKTAGFLKEVTAPFVGIYTTKELIENFND